MNKQKIAELRAGLETGFINSGYNSSLAYQPQFLSNNHKEGKKVLSSIEDELMSCDKFQISVAFITMGGITPLLQTLKELEKNGIPGEILTTNYLNFSEPKALEKLHGLSNITLKMYDVEKAAKGFSHKGIYIQRRRDLPNHYRKLKHDKRRTYEQQRVEYKGCIHRAWRGGKADC